MSSMKCFDVSAAISNFARYVVISPVTSAIVPHVLTKYHIPTFHASIDIRIFYNVVKKSFSSFTNATLYRTAGVLFREGASPGTVEIRTMSRNTMLRINSPYGSRVHILMTMIASWVDSVYASVACKRCLNCLSFSKIGE